MKALFYCYDQDPSGVLLSCANQGFCYLNLAGATKFKYEKKNEKNSGRSSKKTRISIQQIKGLFTWKWGTPGR